MAAALPDPDVPESTAARAIARAGETFLASERVKMQDLADQLGVTRMTLHRAVGTRSQLLGDILWSLSEPLVRTSRAATPGGGAPALASAFGAFVRVALASSALRAFLDREPTIALAVLTTTQSRFQTNVVGLVTDLLEQESRAGRLTLAFDAADVAYAVVRLLEAFTYNDLITGGDPDPVKAEQAVLALLT